MRPVTLLASRSSIRMQDPLKQGLKPLFSEDSKFYICYSNARSTKTRIETRRGELPLGQPYIRMQDPLKQGLKLTTSPSKSIPTVFECKIH